MFKYLKIIKILLVILNLECYIEELCNNEIKNEEKK